MSHHRTPSHIKALLPILQAFAQGKAIQHRSGPRDAAGQDTWMDYSALSFDDAPTKYRIKPEPSEPPHGNPDAKAWAKSFVEHAGALPGIACDAEAMTGWFANAMAAAQKPIIAANAAITHKYAVYAVDYAARVHYFIELLPDGGAKLSHEPGVLFPALARLYAEAPRKPAPKCPKCGEPSRRIDLLMLTKNSWACDECQYVFEVVPPAPGTPADAAHSDAGHEMNDALHDLIGPLNISVDDPAFVRCKNALDALERAHRDAMKKHT